MDNYSNNTKNTNNSLQSLSKHRDRKHDTIPFRLNFVKAMLENNSLNSIIYDNTQDTEAFVNPYSPDDDKTKNTKHILNKKLHNFYSIITKLDSKLEYIKSGTTGHTFKGIINNEGEILNYAVKVVAYPKRERYGNMYNVERPENAELMMIRLLSYFVVKKQSPHIVLPIGTFNTNITPFVDLIESSIVDEDNKKYNEFIQKYKKGEYYSKVSILISEWANKGDLLDYLRKHYKSFTAMHWKVIFFQLISVLAVIQSKYPSFRHNDLKANNVLLHRVVKKKSCYSYKVVGQRYKVPSIGFQIKIWDFDFACIPEIVNNSKVSSEWTSKINIDPVQNRYYDMHYFFNTLIKKGFFPQFMTEDDIPQEAKDFVNRIVPKRYQKGKYVSDKGRILINKEYVLPKDVLAKDPYFSEFRETQKENTSCNNNIKTVTQTTHSKRIKNQERNITETMIPETSD